MRGAFKNLTCTLVITCHVCYLNSQTRGVCLSTNKVQIKAIIVNGISTYICSGTTVLEPPLTNVFTMQWFLTLFSTCLPRDTVLRVWDLILLEGKYPSQDKVTTFTCVLI